MDVSQFDMTGFSQRSDGQWRTDAAQAYHETYLAECKANRERAELTAKLCSADPLLKSLDSHLDRAGINNWTERYLIIADLLELVERAKLPSPQQQEMK